MIRRGSRREALGPGDRLDPLDLGLVVVVEDHLAVDEPARIAAETEIGEAQEEVVVAARDADHAERRGSAAIPCSATALVCNPQAMAGAGLPITAAVVASVTTSARWERRTTDSSH